MIVILLLKCRISKHRRWRKNLKRTIKIVTLFFVNKNGIRTKVSANLWWLHQTEYQETKIKTRLCKYPQTVRKITLYTSAGENIYSCAYSKCFRGEISVCLKAIWVLPQTSAEPWFYLGTSALSEYSGKAFLDSLYTNETWNILNKKCGLQSKVHQCTAHWNTGCKMPREAKFDAFSWPSIVLLRLK